MEKFLIFIITSLSTITVVLTILFEGKLKKECIEHPKLKDVPKEFGKLSNVGWLLLSTLIILTLGNGVVSYTNVLDNNKKYIEDTTRYVQLIKKLEKDGIKDSIEISELEKIVSINGEKSDLIKKSIVDNAVAALEEQRKAVEMQKENTFIHMQSEIEDNLKKIILHYKEDHIKGFADTSYFIATRLNNTYLKQYQTISSKHIIIEHLMETSALIDKVNFYAEEISSSHPKTDGKKLNIRMFLNNVEAVKEKLYLIYTRLYNLTSYKNYETFDFSDSTIIDRKILDHYILEDFTRNIDKLN